MAPLYEFEKRTCTCTWWHDGRGGGGGGVVKSGTLHGFCTFHISDFVVITEH